MERVVTEKTEKLSSSEELLGGERAIRKAIQEKKPIPSEKRLEGREAILAVLAKAADDKEFVARLAEDPARELMDYYTLTKEELAALISGDIKKIEKWVGKLDKRHAAWLWGRISLEKW